MTACYNSEATIAWTIRSFLAQTYRRKELLIIDGGSTDRTLEIAKGLANANVRIISEPDDGIYDAMNKGLRLYTGDAIGFLNSDDTFHDPGALMRIAGGLHIAEAVHSGVRFVKDHKTKEVVRVWKSESFKRGQFKNGWMPPHPTFYVRRSLAERTGEFDLSYSTAADYDYMLRALELHAESATCVLGPLIDFQAGGLSSGFGRIVSANLACLRSRQKNLNAPLLDVAFFLKPGRKILAQTTLLDRVRSALRRNSLEDN